jgi:hypothetical protein
MVLHLLAQALTQFMEVNMFRIEHDIATGEVKEIALTATEIKAIEKLHKEAAEKNATMQAEAEAKAAQRQLILDKLGLTDDEARLLLG